MSELTYPEHAATAGQLPAGYRHVVRRALIGTGEDAFERAVAALFGWQVHRRAGLTVLSGPPPSVGARVVTRLGPPIIGQVAPCRVVFVVDEPRRQGFAYGTVQGHPFRGEESFVVELADDGEVYFHIRAFSQPATTLVRLAGPIVRRLQDIVTDRFVRAAKRAALG